MRTYEIVVGVAAALAVVAGVVAGGEPPPPPEMTTVAPQIGDIFRARATLNEIAVSRFMEISLWEVPFGGTGTGNGRIVAGISPRSEVQIERRAWSIDEQRYYYWVRHALGSGWVAETFVTLL